MSAVIIGACIAAVAGAAVSYGLQQIPAGGGASSTGAGGQYGSDTIDKEADKMTAADSDYTDTSATGMSLAKDSENLAALQAGSAPPDLQSQGATSGPNGEPPTSGIT